MKSLERKFERLNYLIERLKDEAYAGALLIVEGEKDVISLRSIGISSGVIAIKSHGKTLQDIMDTISSYGGEVIILTDFDRKGRELAERLHKSLEGVRVKVNLRYWKELYELLNGDIKDIEGLATCLNNLRRKIEKKCLEE